MASLKNYIQAELKKGVSPDAIRHEMIAHGWTEGQVREIFKSIPASAITDPGMLSGIPSAGKLLKSSWDIFFEKQKSILPVLFISLLCYVLAGIVAYFSVNFALSYIVFGGSNAVAFWILVIVALFLGAVVSWVQTALVMVITGRKEQATVFDTFLSAIIIAPSFFWVVSLVMVSVLFGSIVLLPGVLFFTWFCFAPLMVVTKQSGGVKALVTSYRLVKGSSWQIISRLVFVYVPALLLIYLLLALIQALFATQFVLATFAAWCLIFVGGFFTVYFSPFVWIYPFVLYEHMLEQKEVRAPSHTLIVKGALLIGLGLICVAFLQAYGFFLKNFHYKISIDTPAPSAQAPKVPPLPSLVPTDAPSQTDEFLQLACKKAPVSPTDSCTGYHLMLPGYSAGCYTYAQCVNEYHIAQIAPKLIEATGSAIATPSAHATSSAKPKP